MHFNVERNSDNIGWILSTWLYYFLYSILKLIIFLRLISCAPINGFFVLFTLLRPVRSQPVNVTCRAVFTSWHWGKQGLSQKNLRLSRICRYNRTSNSCDKKKTCQNHSQTRNITSYNQHWCRAILKSHLFYKRLRIKKFLKINDPTSLNFWDDNLFLFT